MAHRKPARIKTLRRQIRRDLNKHLRDLGFQRETDGSLVPPAFTKDSLRQLHRFQRVERLKENQEFITAALPRFLHHFASGKDIDPRKIKPKLELVKGQTWQSDLFRLASLTWSVPVSQGYGRRMRFLVWDQSNEKLIGLIALGDPVFNLRPRDEFLKWQLRSRQKRLVCVMDAHVLGALPPYNMLLGGKLVACLVRTKEIRAAFAKRYGRTKGEISKEYKHATLAVVTTSSSLGKSSVYDRLKIDGVEYLHPVGYTDGWGHFHIPEELFKRMRVLLKKKRHPYSKGHQYGDGPNWRLRAVRVVLQDIGMDPNVLRHGIRREVYVCMVASNAQDLLRGRIKHPYARKLKSVDEVAALALARWVVPRSQRRTEYLQWTRDSMRDMLDPSKDGSASLVTKPPQESPVRPRLIVGPKPNTREAGPNESDSEDGE
jgi:hypothetical protein